MTPSELTALKAGAQVLHSHLHCQKERLEAPCGGPVRGSRWWGLPSGNPGGLGSPFACDRPQLMVYGRGKQWLASAAGTADTAD